MGNTKLDPRSLNAEDAKREALWRKLLNHLDEQVIDKLDADGSCSLCKELRAALGLEEIK